MDKRNAKIIVNNVGGTASKGSKTYKIALPTKWVQLLGLEDGKSVELSFDGEQIVISKKLDNLENLEKLINLNSSINIDEKKETH